MVILNESVMILNKDLQYNIGDIILVGFSTYEIIGYRQCKTCGFNILGTCQGQPIFKHRRTGTETTICGLTTDWKNSAIKRAYTIVKFTNIRW
jgi:hypothetical protein